MRGPATFAAARNALASLAFSAGTAAACEDVGQGAQFCPEDMPQLLTPAPDHFGIVAFRDGAGRVVMVEAAEPMDLGDDPVATLRARLNDMAELAIGGDIHGFVPLIEDRPSGLPAPAVRFAFRVAEDLTEGEHELDDHAHDGPGAIGRPTTMALTLMGDASGTLFVSTVAEGEEYMTEAHALLHQAALEAVTWPEGDE
ncbi:hypothetical protein [Wenxinia marina]|uniref:Secreted protein n=1 Tax=Wenxinia marina DSM 24838 TaxID=1123501 RepID=A0A0D0PZ80_9RHOB|nr:hypothetical protein [Wenxinia marina]KIQ67669.1 hypothetical protein Wenmar_03798 [Wenxinia marina DSM 24838]GGL79868.1 hypothetical protein GCM10011392_37970 [Wenxinia marina]